MQSALSIQVGHLWELVHIWEQDEGIEPSEKAKPPLRETNIRRSQTKVRRSQMIIRRSQTIKQTINQSVKRFYNRYLIPTCFIIQNFY